MGEKSGEMCNGGLDMEPFVDKDGGVDMNGEENGKIECLGSYEDEL